MTPLLRLALLAAIVCPLVGQTFDALMTQGVQLSNNSDIAGAIAQFERAVELQPNNRLGLLHLAQAHESRHRTGGAPRALELYARVLEIDPDNPTALWNQAILKLRLRDLSGAEAALKKYQQAVPGSADAFYVRGVINWARAFPAQMQARQAASQPPSDPPPIADTAVRRRFRQAHSETVETGLDVLDQAIVLDPGHTDALAYRNLLLRTKADMADTGSEAAALLTQADEMIRRIRDLKARRGATTETEPESMLDATKPPPLLPGPPPPPPPPPPPGARR